jgi:hypothetical protein
MKHLFLLLVLCLVLSSCAPQSALTPTPISVATQVLPPPPSLTAAPATTPTPELTFQDIFVPDAWVSNPKPSLGSVVTLRGSLRKYEVYLGGMMMHATWPDQTEPRGLDSCDVLVTYGTGVCQINVENYSPGQFVPITVTFGYGDVYYTTYTGFTVQ